MGEIQPLNQQTIPFYNSNSATAIQGSLTQVPSQHHSQTISHAMPPQPTTSLNGTLHPDDLNVLSSQGPPQMATPIQNLSTQLGNINVSNSHTSSLQMEDHKQTESVIETQVDLNFNEDQPSEDNFQDNREAGKNSFMLILCCH